MYRIDKKQKRVILDKEDKEVAIFAKGQEELAEQVCSYLNMFIFNQC